MSPISTYSAKYNWHLNKVVVIIIIIIIIIFIIIIFVNWIIFIRFAC